MGVGANPAVWLFLIALFLLFFRNWIENRKENAMKNTVKSTKRRLYSIASGITETTRAISTSCTAAFVTLAIN